MISQSFSNLGIKLGNNEYTKFTIFHSKGNFIPSDGIIFRYAVRANQYPPLYLSTSKGKVFPSVS
jgi:hypothetical protein